VRRFAKASIWALAALGILVAPQGAPAAGSANTASCPLATETSPGFRTYLPDCRAYEMVTPPFMGGFPPFIAPQAVTPPRQSEYDSESAFFNSFGVFAGAPNSVTNAVFQGTLYLVSRGTDGWHTFSPMPPARFEPELPGASSRVLVIPSADNSTQVWRLLDTAETGSRISLYLHRDKGPFELLGPVTDEPGPAPSTTHLAPILGEYAAADLSRIPLRARLSGKAGEDKWLWPGDTTLNVNNNETLYEYDLSEPGIGTTSSEPKLVGVKNEGRLTSNTEAQLISQCGTVLGGGGNFITGNRLDRSISADGKYLFFTAQKKTIGTGSNQCPGPSPVQPRSSEIYARIDGEQTVAISNPSAADCSLCLAGTEKETAEKAVEATTLQAVFIGASTDGTKVFFTSFQELFDEIKGTAGAPNLYRYDFEAPPGEKLELVSKLLSGSGSAEVSPPPNARYTGISADGERAYFVAKKVLAENASEAIDPVTELPQVAEATKFNLYVWTAPKEGNEASIKFVAQLPAAPTANLNHPIATPDGRFIIFASPARLTKSNKSTGAQIFEYDAVSGALVRVSVGDQGYNDNGNTSTSPPDTGANVIFVSSDGRRVFFQSSNALAPGALNDPTNTFKNIYEWTWSGEVPSEAEARVFLILPAPAQSGAAGGVAADIEGIDPTGDNVYFTTLGKLIPQHVHGQQAIYTARVDGGFPGLTEEADCDADACQGLPAVAAGESVLSSAALLGPGNATNQRQPTRRRCPGGKRKGRKAGNKARCEPKQSKGNRRATNHKRRAGR
jgi:hypothetical protein